MFVRRGHEVGFSRRCACERERVERWPEVIRLPRDPEGPRRSCVTADIIGASKTEKKCLLIESPVTRDTTSFTMLIGHKRPCVNFRAVRPLPKKKVHVLAVLNTVKLAGLDLLNYGNNTVGKK